MADATQAEVGSISEQKHILLMSGGERQAGAVKRVFEDPGRTEFTAAEAKGKELYLGAKPVRKYADVRIYELTSEKGIDLSTQDRLTDEWENRKLFGDEADGMRRAKEAGGYLKHFVDGLGWRGLPSDKQWQEEDLAAKMGDDAGKAEVAQAMKDAEVGIDGYAQHSVAKALGVVDAALEAGDFGVAADVFSRVRSMAENKDIAEAVVEAAGNLVGVGGDNLAVQAPELHRLVIYGANEMGLEARKSLAEAATLAETYRVGVLAQRTEKWHDGGYQYGSELAKGLGLVVMTNTVSGEGDSLGELNDAKKFDQLFENEMGERGGFKKDNLLQTAEMAAAVLEKMSANNLPAVGRTRDAAVAGALLTVVESGSLTKIAGKVGDLLYGLTGDQELGQYLEGLRRESPLVAGAFEKVAVKLSAALEPKEAIKKGGGSMELFAKHFAKEEVAKRGKARAVAEAEAAEREKQEAAVAEQQAGEARKQEEAKIREAAAAALEKFRKDQEGAVGKWWRKSGTFRRGPWETTEAYGPLAGELSRQLVELGQRKNERDLTLQEKETMASLEAQLDWMRSTRPKERK